MNTELENFLEIFEDRVRTAVLQATDEDGEVAVLPRETGFTEVFIESLQDAGQVGDLEITYLDTRFGRGKATANAYDISEADGSMDIAVVLEGASPAPDLISVPSSKVAGAIKNALHVYSAAAKPVYEQMALPDPAREMMERMHLAHATTRTIRVIILVSGLEKYSRNPTFEVPEGLPEIKIDVWDMERLFRATASKLAYESLLIDVEERLGQPLPCLKGPNTADDHICYLAMLPGNLLHDLYHEYGPRLLELNVRSFLQARGKVNRGIRDTLQNEPDHFLAYNNGISITAEKIELVDIPGGGKAISTITGLQVVNGGQTVASIHRAKDRDKADLDNVWVQAKLSVVEPEKLDELVPFISRYSNTQNKVNETDFSANDPFHVRMQQLSDKIWCPGEVTRWFYERARGQWEVARTREGTPARKAQFDQKTPRKQKIDKTMLAKSITAWDQLPHIVSLGNQKCFVRFMKDLRPDWEPDKEYYREAIAKVIILKAAEKIARQIAFKRFRANAIAYTISSISYRTAGRVNLGAIWEAQAVSSALNDTMLNWMPQIYEELVLSADERELNHTEWFKKEDCWAIIQSLDLQVPSDLQDELAKGQPLPNVGAYGRGRRGQNATPRTLTTEERERQAKVMSVNADKWQAIVTWGRDTGKLDTFQLGFAFTMFEYAFSRWNKIPSPKQTTIAETIIELWKGDAPGEED